MAMTVVDKIVPHLYLGDKAASTDLELISRLELTHIVSVELIPLPQVVTSTFPNLAVLQIPVGDREESDLMSHFEVSIYQFISSSEKSVSLLLGGYRFHLGGYRLRWQCPGPLLHRDQPLHHRRRGLPHEEREHPARGSIGKYPLEKTEC